MVPALVIFGCALVIVGCNAKNESKTGPVYMRPKREILVSGPHDDPTVREHGKPDERRQLFLPLNDNYSCRCEPGGWTTAATAQPTRFG